MGRDGADKASYGLSDIVVYIDVQYASRGSIQTNFAF